MSRHLAQGLFGLARLPTQRRVEAHVRLQDRAVARSRLLGNGRRRGARPATPEHTEQQCRAGNNREETDECNEPARFAPGHDLQGGSQWQRVPIHWSGGRRRSSDRENGRRCRIAIDPTDAGVPHLHPRMRVRPAHDALSGLAGEVTLAVPRDQPRGDACAAKHDDGGGRELLAESAMGNEEEVVDGVLPARGHWRRQVVDLVSLHIVVHCAHRVVTRGRGRCQLRREVAHARGQTRLYRRPLRVARIAAGRSAQRHRVRGRTRRRHLVCPGRCCAGCGQERVAIGSSGHVARPAVRGRRARSHHDVESARREHLHRVGANRLRACHGLRRGAGRRPTAAVEGVEHRALPVGRRVGGDSEDRLIRERATHAQVQACGARIETCSTGSGRVAARGGERDVTDGSPRTQLQRVRHREERDRTDHDCRRRRHEQRAQHRECWQTDRGPGTREHRASLQQGGSNQQQDDGRQRGQRRARVVSEESGVREHCRDHKQANHGVTA